MKFTFLSFIMAVLTFKVRCDSATNENEQYPTSNILGCVDDSSWDETIDLFPHKSVVSHSEHWDISYHKNYKIIKNKVVNMTYLFYQCGTEPPVNADVHHVVMPVPLQDGIVLTQTTYIPHVELLEKRTAISAYMGDPQYISSPCLNELILDQSVPVVDNYNATQRDLFIESHPNAIILANPWTDKTLKNHLIIAESSETASNKAVFEWHKVFAALFNLEHLGNQIFDETASRYDCISANAAEVEADKVKPKLLWAFWIDYEDSWSGTHILGWSLGSCPNYYCEFVSDCSAEFMLSEVEGSVDCWGSKCMTDDEFFEFAKDADVWVMPSADFNSVYEQKKDLMEELKVVQNREVYDTYGSGANTWFEQRMAEYDVVLHDVCEVIGSTAPTSFHKRKWLRNVFTEPLGELPYCADVNAPLDTQHTDCEPLPDKNDLVLTNDADGSTSSASSLKIGTNSMVVLSLFCVSLLLGHKSFV